MSRPNAAIRRFPLDIGVIIASVVVAFVAIGLGRGSPVRMVVTLAYLLFVPGYALSTVFFPAKLGPDRRRRAHPLGPAPGAALDGVERAAVSFGMSLVLLPLFGLTLAALSWPFTPWWILVLSGGFVAVAMLVGAIRRIRLPDEARYDLPTSRWMHGVGDGVARVPAVDALLNVILAVAVVTAAGALAVAIVAPQDGSAYTEMTLLTTAEDGEFVAADYPTDLTRGQSEPLVLEVTNHEDRPVQYTVVVKLERVNDGGQVVEADELNRFEKEIPAEGTWQIQHTVTPSMAGDDLRLNYLLYVGEPPENPSASNAYEHVYLWVDVSE